MTDFQEKAIRAIEAQQEKAREHSHQWMVGEQLKDICRMEPRSAELIAQDLTVDAMGIVEAEKKIAAFAKKHGGCASPIEAEQVLREFYGLPAAGEAAPGTAPEQAGGNVLHLEDFF